MAGIANIRKTRGVPAKRGGRVRYTGGEFPRLGTIASARGGYLKIRLDGEKHAGTYHPTWELEYLNSESESATTEQKP